MFKGQNQRKTKNLFFLFFFWRPLVFAPILPKFENGDIQNKNKSLQF